MILSKQTQVLSFTDKRLLSIAYDSKKYQSEAFDFINLYLELISAKNRNLAEVPMFYIKNLETEIHKLPKKERKSIEKFFGLSGGPKHYQKVLRPNDEALHAMYLATVDAASFLQSFDSIYAWHMECHDTISSVAKKVYDPQHKYSDICKAKLAHVYYRYIKGFQYMSYDDKTKHHLLTVQEKVDESRYFGMADVIVQEWNEYFRFAKDGDIIPEMVEYFISILPADIQKFIDEDCQLTKPKYCCTFLGAIRFAKESIFAHGEWINGDCCTISGMSHLRLERVADLSTVSWLVYNSENWKGRHERLKTVFMPNKGFVTFKVQEFVGQRTFVDKTEALMFKKALDVLSTEYPELKFHSNTWASYGFNQKPSYLR